MHEKMPPRVQNGLHQVIFFRKSQNVQAAIKLHISTVCLYFVFSPLHQSPTRPVQAEGSVGEAKEISQNWQ